MGAPAGRRALSGPLGIALLGARAAARSRVAGAAAGAIAFATLVLALTASGDGTPRGRMQAFLSWSFGFAEVVVLLTAVFLSTQLAQGLRSGALTQVVVAPGRRGGLVLSWWAGVCAVLVVLVVLASSGVGAGAALLRWRTEPAARPAIDGVLAARRVIEPAPPDARLLRLRAEAEVAEIAKDPSRLEGISREDAVANREEALRTRSRTAARLQHLTWRLDGVSAAGEEPLRLRFRYQVQRDGAAPADPRLAGRWSIRVAGAPEVTELEGAWIGGETHDLPVPPSVLGDAGSADALEVAYTNLSPRPALAVFPERGVSLLVPGGSFPSNLARAGLVLLGRALFLAALGVGLAAVLEGKLAALVALFALVLGLAHGFLADALAPGVFGALDAPLRGVARATLAVLPDLGGDDLPGSLAAGLRVGERAVLRALGEVALLRGGGALVLAGLLFSRRELGAIR